MEFASSDPAVNIFYYHRLVGSDDNKDVQQRLPDPPRLVHGYEDLCLPDTPAIIDQCSNSQPRGDLWLTCPTEKIPEIYRKVGFVTQLSLLCAAANLKKCHNRKCVETFQVMEADAPPCSWSPFRQWALVAMSCQETLEQILRESLSLGLAPVDKISRPHTHLVNAVHGCCQILENTSPVQDLFVPVHDGFLAPAVDLSEICNIIYWMAHIQAAKKLSIAMLRHWDHRYLPSLVTGPAIREASQKVLSLELCSFRFWNLVDLAERKETDLPAIVNTLNVEDRRRALRHEHHDECAATKCQYSHKDSTKVDQLHICESDCGRYPFPMDELGEALELGHTTAWSRDVGDAKQPHLHNPDKPYIAISHVWADGTGVGVQSQGMVNKCLFDYSSGIAKSLGCDGVWWDALSIPLEPKARSKAIATLHKNYSTAEYTVVHDLYLTNMAFKDPATACLAIVLSPWFTRGWTALELRMSTKVVVLFKGPKKDEPVIKDLDADILAKSPGRVSRTHWLASTIISRLRRSEINYIDDILAILRPRSTSWVRDRTVIAALLTQIPNCDFSGSEGAMTRGIILHLGFVPYSSLLHGRATMFPKGPFSWCPATLDDMPIDLRVDLENQAARRARLLRVENGGAVVGTWHYELVTALQVKKNQVQPHGDHISVAVVFHNALLEWQNCLILRERKTDNGLALLVTTVGLTVEDDKVLLECNYVGAARIAKDEDEKLSGEDHNRVSFPQEAEVRIGLESGRSECCARDVIEQLQSKRQSLDKEKAHRSSVSNDVSGFDKKRADDSGDQDQGGGVHSGQKAMRESDFDYPWYSRPGISHLPVPSSAANQEIEDDSDEEATALRIREHLSRAFRNAHATEILHLLISQNIEVASDVLEQLSFCQLASLSFVYFSNNLSKEAILTSERAASLLPTRSAAGDLATLEALCILGKVSWKTKQFDNADRFYQTLIDRCDPAGTQEQQWKWRAHGEQCLLLIELNQLTRASESYRKAWQKFQDLSTPEDLFGYDFLTRLKMPYSVRDKEQKAAETVYSEALSALERDLGKDHAIVIITAKMLASVLLNKGDIAAAEEILSNILPHLHQLAGPSHLLTLTTRYDLSRAHVSQRRITVPGPMLTLVEDIQGYQGQEHWLTRLTALTTAGFYFMKKEYASAVPLLESAKQRCTTQDTPQEFLAACAKRDLGMVYSMLGKDTARGEYEAAMEDLRNLQHCEHVEWYTTLFCLGIAHQATGDYDAAEKTLADSIGGLQRLCGPLYLETREIVGKLGRLYAKPLLRPSHEVPISHVYRAVYGLKALLERYGDDPGSKGRVKWALPDYKTEFGIDSNDSGERVSPGVNNGDTYLEENEILVQNKAIALRDDLDSIEDNGSDSEEYDELGEASDVSGVVIRVGSREGPFKEGDRVMGQVVYASTKAQRHAGRQHYTVLLTHMTAQIPRTLSFDRAAALPSSASAAAAALFSKSHLGLDLPSVPFKPPGDKFVLVLGGTTSVGCSAVQLAVAAGFRVIATALPKDFDYTHGIGATLLVDCSSPTLVDDLTQELSGKQVVGAINTIRSQEKMDIYGMDVVAAHDIEAVNIKDDDDLSRRIYGFLHIALAEGRYVCAPDPGVNLTTTAVQASLEAHRKVIIAL